MRAKTEVRIAEQEALKFNTLNKALNDKVLYKLFLDKWDGQTQVVPGLGGGTPPVIVGRYRSVELNGRLEEAFMLMCGDVVCSARCAEPSVPLDAWRLR